MTLRHLTARFSWSDKADEWIYYHLWWRFYGPLHMIFCRECYQDAQETKP